MIVTGLGSGEDGAVAYLCVVNDLGWVCEVGGWYDWMIAHLLPKKILAGWMGWGGFGSVSSLWCK